MEEETPNFVHLNGDLYIYIPDTDCYSCLLPANQNRHMSIVK